MESMMVISHFSLFRIQIPVHDAHQSHQPLQNRKLMEAMMFISLIILFRIQIMEIPK
jgi:hypothetical protein